jgi:RNA polymerase sigma-54 factor
METGFDLSQEMRSWVSPSLIEANYILSLSRQELQQAVAAEMESNPALEIEDLLTCPTCGNVLEGAFCPVCLVSQRERPTRSATRTCRSCCSASPTPARTATTSTR